MLPGGQVLNALLRIQRADQNAVDERTFAGAGDAGHAGESPERNFDIGFFEVVQRGAADFQRFPVAGIALLRQRDFPAPGQIVAGQRTRKGRNFGWRAVCDEFAAAVKAYEETVRAEYAGIEDAVSVKVAEVGKPAEMLPKEVAGNLIKAVAACPDGVQRMSVAMPGLVQTSTNLARVVSDGRTVKLQCLLRSSVNTEKEALGESIAALFALAGAKTELTGAYNGWNPDMESPILKAMTASYEALYGKKPAVTAIHAGLECGIIGSAYPGLDMISFGPTICYPHSPDEKVEIASVGKFYDFLVDTLRNVPEK